MHGENLKLKYNLLVFRPLSNVLYSEPHIICFTIKASKPAQFFGVSDLPGLELL